MSERYTVEAGPIGERYTVETKFSPEGVSLASNELGWDKATMDGALLMLKGMGELGADLEAFKVATSEGELVSLATLERTLTTWTHFDRWERKWEDRCLSQEPWLDSLG